MTMSLLLLHGTNYLHQLYSPSTNSFEYSLPTLTCIFLPERNVAIRRNTAIAAPFEAKASKQAWWLTPVLLSISYRSLNSIILVSLSMMPIHSATGDLGRGDFYTLSILADCSFNFAARFFSTPASLLLKPLSLMRTSPMSEALAGLSPEGSKGIAHILVRLIRVVKSFA